MPSLWQVQVSLPRKRHQCHWTLHGTFCPVDVWVLFNPWMLVLTNHGRLVCGTGWKIECSSTIAARRNQRKCVPLWQHLPLKCGTEHKKIMCGMHDSIIPFHAFQKKTLTKQPLNMMMIWATALPAAKREVTKTMKMMKVQTLEMQQTLGKQQLSES